MDMIGIGRMRGAVKGEELEDKVREARQEEEDRNKIN